jgi:hypothetical protein
MINIDQFYCHRDHHRKKISVNDPLANASRFVRAQLAPEPTSLFVKLEWGHLILYLPLDKPLQSAQLISLCQ